MGKRDFASRGPESSTPVILTWKELWVSVSIKSESRNKRHLLHGMTGYAEPGNIMAIMGPSGSGKTVLLDTLAGHTHTHNYILYLSFLYPPFVTVNLV